VEETIAYRRGCDIAAELKDLYREGYTVKIKSLGAQEFGLTHL
jgi:hypothetical protein